MTVETELCEVERSWTGNETQFATGFKAKSKTYVKVGVKQADPAEDPLPLQLGVHFDVTLAADDMATVLPLALPTPPKTLVIERQTPATQGTNFEDLGRYSADVHEDLHDLSAMRDAELERGLGEMATDIAEMQAELDAALAVLQQMVPINVPIYQTRTAVSLAPIDASVQGLLVHGTTDPADQGDAVYRKVGSEPTHPGKVQSAGASPFWFEIRKHIVRPESFRAWTGADDKLALQYAAEYIRHRNGGAIEFYPDRIYKVPDNGLGGVTGIANGGPLLDFDADCKSVTIAGNGAKILFGNVTDNIRCIWLNGCQNVNIGNLRLESQYTTLDPTFGVHWIAATNGAKRIAIRNVDAVSGSVGLQCLGVIAGAASDTNRVEQVSMLNSRFEKVYYPQSFPGAGDHYFARGIVTRNCGRSYFPYNVLDHDVQMDSQQGGALSDCLLKCYGSSGFVSRLQQIKLVYHTDGRFPGAGNQNIDEAIVAMDCQLYDVPTGSAVIMRDIDIGIVAEIDPSDRNYSIFIIRKFDGASAPDNIARGHYIYGLDMHMTVVNGINLLGAAARFFTLNNWAGDTIELSSLRASSIGVGSAQVAVEVDGRGFATTSEAFRIQSVQSGGDLTATNVSGKGFVLKDSKFDNSNTFTPYP